MQGYEARRDQNFKKEQILFMDHLARSHSSVLLHRTPDRPWHRDQLLKNNLPDTW